MQSNLGVLGVKNSTPLIPPIQNYNPFPSKMKHPLLLAVLLFTSLFLAQKTNAQSITINGPAGSGAFGSQVYALPNGNYVVADPEYDEGSIDDVGAVYLYHGSTHALISTLKGSTAGDKVGTGILILSESDFAVVSYYWNNGTATNAGAITWGSNITGVNGIVSASNSLIGTSTNDHVGYPLYVLSNEKYVLASPEWDNGTIEDVGAVTLIDNMAPLTGEINATNSILGSSLNDRIGVNIGPLDNGNFVIFSPFWDNGDIIDAGAVTWIDGSITSLSGHITTENSLYGSTEDDNVGFFGSLLSNGNFLVQSPLWSSDNAVQAGAVTWVNGSNGIIGPVNASNSLVGSSEGDFVGLYCEALIDNSNYVVLSPGWDSGDSVDVGAVTWASGATGIAGEINATNSLIGTNSYDQVGGNGYATLLSNGNYVIHSPYWKNGTTCSAGAVTWADGTIGIQGEITSSNSLVGTSAYDMEHGYITPLSNGNYVISSPDWTNNTISSAGAVTWADGSTGINGEITSANSLVGTSEYDKVGSNVVHELTNGNYVVASPNWNNGTTSKAGAATWGDGSAEITGEVSVNNSLVGTSEDDRVGSEIISLNNGNYVVSSTQWNSSEANTVGAATWGNGTSGSMGEVNSSNSLIGSSSDDFQSVKILPLKNGNYVVSASGWDNDAVVNAGAVTWGNGTIGTTGEISSSNSLVGSTTEDGIGDQYIIPLYNGNYIVRSPFWDNGTIGDAGAITWGNGTGGTIGEISIDNSVVGTSQDDKVSLTDGYALPDGNFMLASEAWSNNAGAVTFINSASSTTGTINECNSVVGKTQRSTPSAFAYDYNGYNSYLLVGKPADSEVVIYHPTFKELAVNEDEITTSIVGNGGVPVLLINDDCRIIASFTPQEENPVTGIVSAKVWVDEDQAKRYLKRHYEITPDNNAAEVKASVTLYFSQAEFNAYNTQNPAPALLLPANESDATGKANLLIEKLPGKSSDGSGKPNSYTTGTAQTIDPRDYNIVWNATADRWEVTFDVTGFSGFFVKTLDEPLPVRLVSFTAKAVENTAQLQWSVADAMNFSHFEVEKSSNSKQFTKVDDVQLASTNYLFTDPKAATSPLVYYRLKLVDLDGSYTYSRIEPVRFDKSQLLASGYPNPFNATLTLVSNSNQTASITNLVGNTIVSIQLVPGENKVSTNNWPNGLYLVRTSNGELVKVIKE